MKNAAKILALATLGLSFSGCLEHLSQADLSDPGIKARVEARLQARKDLDLRAVTVDVHSRIVTVSGMVGSWEDKRTIEIIVRRIRGVDQALINLAVRE